MEGELQFQDITVDPTTGSVICRAVFPNPKAVLLPGMFIRGVVKEGLKKDAILIPQQCVARDTKGNPTVLIVNAKGEVEQRNSSSSPPFALDRAIKDEWLVASGLASGDRVIVEGLQRVRPGAPVKVVPADAAKSN
jgi:membrane fusion protein (multidrug efflux system)